MKKPFVLVLLCSLLGGFSAQAQLASERPLTRAYGRQVAQTPAATRTTPSSGRTLPSEAVLPPARVQVPRKAAATQVLPSERRLPPLPDRKPVKRTG